jgi:addiction module RelE/StbE family toxin
MVIHWTQRALRRLDRHTTYVALRSPTSVDAMTQRIFDAVDALAENPPMGREGRYLGTRELVIEKGHYVVVYRVRGQTVQIVTVHDTRQQWPEDWKDA